MQAMDALLDDLPVTMREMVSLRYRENASWAYISMRLNYSIDHIKVLDRQVVQALGEKIDVNGMGVALPVEGEKRTTRNNTSAVV